MTSSAQLVTATASGQLVTATPSAKLRWMRATAKITEQQADNLPTDRQHLLSGQKFRNMVREVVEIHKTQGDFFSPAEFGFSAAAGPGFADEERPLAQDFKSSGSRRFSHKKTLAIENVEANWIPVKERGEWRTRPFQILTIVLFLIFDSSRTISDYRALSNERYAIQISQELVVAHSGIALLSALLVSAVAGGGNSVKRALSPAAVLQMFPVAVEFTLSQVALGQAYALGLEPADKEALGYMYMPICALMSRYIFRRAYGWLSWQSLAVLTLCSVTFVEMRNRALENRHGVLDTFTVGYALVSTLCSATAAVLAERVIKSKYNVLAEGERFYVQKARLELGGTLTAAALYLFFSRQEASGTAAYVPFGSAWGRRTYLALVLRVCQSWLSGILVKRLSAVAKAVIQSISLLIVFFVANIGEINTISQEHVDNGDGQGAAVLILPVCFLAVVVALTAVMYQMGRYMTLEMRGAGRGLRATPAAVGRILDKFGAPHEHGFDRPGRGFNGRWMKADGLVQEIRGHRLWWATGRQDILRITGPSTFYIERDGDNLHAELIADGWQLLWSSGSTWFREEDDNSIECSPPKRQSLSEHLGAPVTDEFAGEEASGWCPSLADIDLFGMSTTAAQRLLMAPERAIVYEFLSTRIGMIGQLGAVVAFIIADAAQVLCMEAAYRGAPIVGQSIAFSNFFLSFVIGTIVSTVLYGKEDGLMSCLSRKDILEVLPAAVFFALSTTAGNLAYASGISGSVNTVLGYFYMPCAAGLSRWVFGRAYSSLEWIALVVIALSAIVFALIKQIGPPGAEASDDGPVQPATTPRAAGLSLLCVIFSCIAAVFVEKIMKAKPQPFFVQKVHLEIGCSVVAIMMFEVVQHIGRDTDGWRSERNCTVAQPRIYNGTRFDDDPQWGPYCCWSLSTYVALFARIIHSWLGGLVAKQLSTTVKAVCTCLSLLLIYFFGDLVLKGEAFDWPVGVMAVVVSLSVTIFTLAGQGVKRVWKSEPVEETPATIEMEEELLPNRDSCVPMRDSCVSRCSVDSDGYEIDAWHVQGLANDRDSMAKTLSSRS